MMFSQKMSKRNNFSSVFVTNQQIIMEKDNISSAKIASLNITLHAVGMNGKFQRLNAINAE